MFSVARLYASVKVGKETYKHPIADLLVEASETQLASVEGSDLKFEQMSDCTLEKLYIEFYGLHLPVNLIGAPFGLKVGDSQRLCDISIAVEN